jgi:hypothetical protein
VRVPQPAQAGWLQASPLMDALLDSLAAWSRPRDWQGPYGQRLQVVGDELHGCTISSLGIRHCKMPGKPWPERSRIAWLPGRPCWHSRSRGPGRPGTAGSVATVAGDSPAAKRQHTVTGGEQAGLSG